jgi:hypothetical protein
MARWRCVCLCMYAGHNVYGHMTHVAPPRRHMYTDLGIAVGYVRKRLQKSHTAALHFASRINLPTWLIQHEDDGESWPLGFPEIVQSASALDVKQP